MKRFTLASLMVIVAAGTTAGCAAGTNVSLPQAQSQLKSEPASGGGGSSTFYVSSVSSSQNASVIVYTEFGKSVVRTVQQSEQISDLLSDASGHLYVATGFGQDHLLNIYSDKASKLVQTLHQKEAFNFLTLDGSGNLWTSCAIYSVCKYAQSKRTVLKAQPEQRLNLRNLGVSPGYLSADAAGDLAVADRSTVLVFAPGASQPEWKLSSSVYQTAIAFDPNGNLYVATGQTGDQGTIKEYAIGTNQPIRTLADPNGWRIVGLNFDAAGNLYALNSSCVRCSAPAVTVFGTTGSEPLRSITKGLNNFGEFVSLAVSTAGAVFVADAQLGAVAVYRPGDSEPLRTITNGLDKPYYIASGEPIKI